ncbi:MAG: hypothetical protein KBE09_00985 [Candidatus Pacebacteria bacterium]|nr:hypothetical protein [Candidatus Paceibacterota bacterium]
MKRCKSGNVRSKESVRASHWVANLPPNDLEALKSLIFNYDAWTPETDLRDTKSAGIVQFKGHYVIWVIREMDVTP